MVSRVQVTLDPRREHGMSKLGRGSFAAWGGPLAVSLLIVAGCSSSSSDAPQDPLAVAVTVEPTTARLAPSAHQQFLAAVTGSADTTVTWQVSQGCGSITTTGLYTAPALNASCQVVVTSHADPTKSATALVTVQSTPPPPTGDTAWEPLKVGAGGFLTGIDIDPSGSTYVVRTDTYGAYVSDGSGPWQQIVTSTSMPASIVDGLEHGTYWPAYGVYEIRIAPSNPDRFYMIYGDYASGVTIWRSDDRGSTWMAASAGYSSGGVDPNDGTRGWGEKMAVDPANPDVVYAGAGGGMYVTTNGGGSWSLTGLPAPTHSAAITGITFDSTGGTTGTCPGASCRTNRIYAVSNGRGVYRSTNAGGTWSLLTGGPATAAHAALGSDGILYVVNLDDVVYKFASGAWSTSASLGGQSVTSITVDPTNPARIVAANDGGNLAVSTDRGASWIGGGVIWNKTRHATDVPWLANANEDYMSNAAQLFDPVVPNKVWFAQGIGVWYADPSNTSQTTWTSHSVGIEQLVAMDVIAPPGSPNVLLAGSDRSVWVVPRANASYPNDYVKMGSSASLIAGHSVNYSHANAQHLVAIINRGTIGEPELSGYSLNGGSTWAVFPSQPGSGGACGDVVAPSIDNIIAVIGHRYAFRSTNRGSSWTRLTLPGDGGADTDNLHAGFATCQKHILAVDGADPSTVYLYFYGHGVYRSTNGGGTWTLVNSGGFDGNAMFWQVHLRSVPGQGGHLFMTAGSVGGENNPNPTSLWRSTDGGASWTTMPNVAEPIDVVLGAAAPGHTYPAVYFAGWHRTGATAPWVWGIWRSIDFDVNPANPTWTQIGYFPLGRLDQINNMAASLDTFGEIYVAYAGSGWVTGRIR
jgi:photosystem II stability/assembly factor-like uncharacterized protein